MKIKLKDIIDLDYLVGRDEALSSEAEIGLRQDRDQKIFEHIKKTCGTDREFLLAWLEKRRQEENESGPLPGTVFSSLYSFMIYALVFFGIFSGLSVSWSFLAYHGTRPVNVALFISLFIGLQVVLILMTAFFLILRSVKIRFGKGKFQNSILHTLLSSLFFNVLPDLMKKAESRIFKKGADSLEYTTTLIRMKTREFSELFFWPFFILIAAFSFCFTSATLIGTFFRIIVSDMAFGWQSTLMTTSETIHDLLTWMALPWSWFIHGFPAHPTLAQVDGSRIILKDGISVLATQDLVSWWPFLCLGILSYAVIPRGILMAVGILAQNHVLQRFNFDRAIFKPLLIRMRSSVLDVDTGISSGNPLAQDIHDGAIVSSEDDAFKKPESSGNNLPKALVLTPQSVYSDEAGQKINHHISTRLFFDVKERINVSLDPDQDTEIFTRIKTGDADQVVLVHEAWQPPIRGLLYYMERLKSVMPEKMMLWVLLTGDAGSENLYLKETDVNFEIWKMAVFKLEDPGIKVMRLI